MASENIVYGARITAGSNTYSLAGIHNYTHTRWHHVMWWNGDNPEIYAKLNEQYLQATKAVPTYQSGVHPTESFLVGRRQGVKPMDNGDLTETMGNTGAQPTIGPYPRWTSAYLTSMDYRAYRWMLAADAAASSYNVYFRDPQTNRPITIRDYPYMTLVGHYGDTQDKKGRYEAFPSCASGAQCDDPNVPDAAHEPSIGYVSYMVTGDFYYLEQLQFWANWNALRMNPGYREHEQGLLHSNQARAQGWDLRTLGDAAYITPDNDPLQSYFAAMLKNNADWYKQNYTIKGTSPHYNELGAVTDHALVYSGYREMAPWQDDFITWSIGHLVSLGFDGFKPFLDWKARFPVGRMATPDFCYVWAAAYTLTLRDGKNGLIYTTFKKVYEESIDASVRSMGCGSSDMTAHIRKTRPQYQSGDMQGYPYSATGFPANMQPALAAAANAGIANSATAWSNFEKHQDPRVASSYDDYANYAVVPRSLAPTDKPVLISFYADPNPVPVGGSTTLHWRSLNATSCTGAGGMSGTSGFTKPVTPGSSIKTVTITCSNGSGTAQAAVNVADSAQILPVVTISASPTTVESGQGTVLTWSAKHADQCYAHGAWDSSVKLTGTQSTGPLKQSSEFRLNCSNALGSTIKWVDVQVGAGALGPSDVDSGGSSASSGKGDRSGGGAALSLFGCLWLLGCGVALRRRLQHSGAG